jgi:hypothetical protein
MLLFIVIFIVIIVLPFIWLLVKLANWFIKKGYKKATYIALCIIGLFVVYSIYTAIYPPDRFYIEDFEYYTELKFPPSSKILKKNADYPDQHGKYTSIAVVQLSKSDYKNLLLKVATDTTFTTDTTIGISNSFDEVTAGVDKKGIIKIVRKKKMKLAFLKDSTHLLIEKHFYNF